MTLDTFCEITKTRIPTPSEFIDFAESQGWSIKTDGVKGYLKASPSDELAVALARMLSREPYRTNVIEELYRRAKPDFGDDARPDTITLPPLPSQEPADEITETGQAEARADLKLMGSERKGCALRHQEFKAGSVYRYEVCREGTLYWVRVYTEAAVCCLRPARFEETFLILSASPVGSTEKPSD